MVISRSTRFLGTRRYDDAIDSLNSLQTPFAVLEQRRQESEAASFRRESTGIQEMREWLRMIGYSTKELNRLNIVHVAGTKGKGSTCAYVDSILRAHRDAYGVPRKIGLYTSPHLIDVRERIRLNMTPLPQELFTKYFWEVWDALERSAVSENRDPLHKPVYFRFLTLMSFHVFLREEVDVAIYEVGVGGEFDSTNVVEKPIVAGITALGIDHVRVLGETIGEIAWHKAGILKAGCPAFTVIQDPVAMEVIEKRAREKNATITEVDIHPALHAVRIMPDADFQRSNASIAIELAKTTLPKFDKDFDPQSDALSPEFVRGLETVIWRGRCELKIEQGRAWYLDGAHTVDSIRVAAAWFGRESRSRQGQRILIFNQQARPEALAFLEVLYHCLHKDYGMRFEHVIFCTNMTKKSGFKKGISGNHSRYGELLCNSPLKPCALDMVNHNHDETAIKTMSVQKSFAEAWAKLDTTAEVAVQPSIEDALEYVQKVQDPSGMVQIFVTGSTHLVGGVLALLEGDDAVV